jgi:hypothetical protein
VTKESKSSSKMGARRYIYEGMKVFLNNDHVIDKNNNREQIMEGWALDKTKSTDI